MRRDANDALTSFFEGQCRRGTESFEAQLRTALDAECTEMDFEPIVTGMRKSLPVAAAIAFGLLTSRASKSDVDGMASSIEKSRTQASSVQTELETQWDD